MRVEHSIPDANPQMPPLNGSASALAICQAIEQSPTGVGGLVAVAFLRWLDPTGVHHVVAFDPSGKKQVPVDKITGTLEGDGAAMFAAFVDRHNGKNNLYFHINAPRADFDGYKASDADIAWFRAIPVDKDPVGLGDITQERITNVQLFVEKLGANRPSCMLDSGNGHWAFYLLPQPMAHSDENGRWYRAQSRALAVLMGSDSVVDPSRIARLPGTTNVPDAGKRAKGRTEAQAAVFAIDDTTYSRHTLEQAYPPVWEAPQVDRDPRVRELMDAYQGAHYQLASLDNLEPALAEKLKADRAASPKIDQMIQGDFSGTKQKGAGGKRNSFATTLGSYGSGYDVDEFAEVMWAVFSENFAPDYCDQQLDVRQMARLRESYERAERDFRASKSVDVEKFFDRDASRSQALQDLMQGIVSVSGKIDPKTIALREWLVAPRLPIGDAAQVAGEPGVSKSTFTLQDALAVSTGNERILRGENDVGPDRLFRTGPVILYNAEDRLDEMRRRLTAMQDFYGIKEAPHKIHLWSGVDNTELKLMERKSPKDPLVRAAGADLLEEMIVHTGAVLVILDPQVSLARGAIENSTEDGNDLFQMLARMATKLKISILVVHHTAKHTRNDHGDMGAGRGAFSVMGKVRSAFTLVNVTEGEAKEWGYPPGDDLVRLDYAKVSHGRKPKTATIYRRRSMLVGNGTGIMGDKTPLEGSPLDHFRAVGDDAPVFEIVGLGMKQGDAPEPLNAGQARRIAVAEAVAKVLGDRAEASLPTIFHQIGGALNEAGISKATSRPAITDLVKTSLAGRGVQIMHAGQSVWVNAEQRGVGATAPWFLVIRQQEPEALKLLEAQGVFS